MKDVELEGGGTISNVAEALHAVADGIVDETEVMERGAPSMVCVVMVFDDDTVYSTATGPGYNPHAHMSALASAGTQVMEALGMVSAGGLLLPDTPQ